MMHQGVIFDGLTMMTRVILIVSTLECSLLTDLHYKKNDIWRSFHSRRSKMNEIKRFEGQME